MLPNLDVDLLKTFAVLAETGNFTRTAEEVGRTQSAVSMQLKRLEEQMGLSLLDRSARSIALTPQIKALTGIEEDAVTPAALMHALLEPEQWQEWSKAGLTNVHTHYSWERHVERYLRDIKEVLKNANTPPPIVHGRRSRWPSSPS